MPEESETSNNFKEEDVKELKDKDEGEGGDLPTPKSTTAMSMVKRIPTWSEVPWSGYGSSV